MKVAVFAEALWPWGEGGGELATYLYAVGLRELGAQVRVFVRRGGPPPRGLEVVELGGAGTRKFHVPPLAARRALEWADVAYFASAYWELIPLAKRVGRKAVVHLHSYEPACPMGTLYNWSAGSVCRAEERRCWSCIWHTERALGRSILRALASQAANVPAAPLFVRALRSADAAVFVSEAQRRLFVAHARDLPKSYVLYNPAPRLSYSPPAGRGIGYFGGLNPLKGYRVLLEAWRRLGLDGELHMTRAEGLRDPPRGVRVYGSLSPEELDSLYLKIWAVAVPSIWEEPFSYVALEGLVRGRLVVASKAGGLPEVLEGAPGTFLVPRGDPAALAEALERSLEADAEELGAKNREVALRRFDGLRQAEKLMRIMES